MITLVNETNLEKRFILSRARLGEMLVAFHNHFDCKRGFCIHLVNIVQKGEDIEWIITHETIHHSLFRLIGHKQDTYDELDQNMRDSIERLTP